MQWSSLDLYFRRYLVQIFFDILVITKEYYVFFVSPSRETWGKYSIKLEHFFSNAL